MPKKPDDGIVLEEILILKKIRTRVERGEMPLEAIERELDEYRQKPFTAEVEELLGNHLFPEIRELLKVIQEGMEKRRRERKTPPRGMKGAS